MRDMWLGGGHQDYTLSLSLATGEQSPGAIILTSLALSLNHYNRDASAPTHNPNYYYYTPSATRLLAVRTKMHQHTV